MRGTRPSRRCYNGLPSRHPAWSSSKDYGQLKIDLSELDRIYACSKPANMSGNTSIAELMTAKDREIALHQQLAEQAEATAVDLRKSATGCLV
jgi:hypothetical protein